MVCRLWTRTVRESVVEKMHRCVASCGRVTLDMAPDVSVRGEVAVADGQCKELRSTAGTKTTAHHTQSSVREHVKVRINSVNLLEFGVTKSSKVSICDQSICPEAAVLGLDELKH